MDDAKGHASECPEARTDAESRNTVNGTKPTSQFGINGYT